ncbi:RNA polymerase sigma-70 factor (sigma-E family) [Saccharothrix coeruleofusca]|uniref:SigE family RNA polymerase sigma factor n=1 Tax=Saccharothrix coeruleofusca TaxID=33919 RepID=UPI001AEB5107|nr:SigE family RNA polymerase sigma factor [Saccharothrix coeruleofusca]MBP2337672.1 RNA polymerase sigma-70 factor (sigma-E family) [Saccharothrix coeruleofusca]
MAGAPEGFEEFVAGASPRLLRTAYLLTRDQGHAEDLLQTALARAWSAWRRITVDPEPYVRRIMVNTYATWWRRRWRGEEPTPLLPEGASAAPQDAVAEREWLWQALGELPRRQRAVLVLRFFEDMTEAQAAGVLGCSVGTVKSQTSKALAKLRLDERFSAEESRR